ncbi:MAG: 3-isopropylmalate dehydratase large subunit [Alphaproteobacteria bacterium]|jgi:3-isopropylmalate/(R)-2-methylmalate dehydratase large subunit|nr:3-isopropylmalate dehydratase large subunit [Rhodospirillaceae bacterium]MDP6406827.1 3-isopropylmalate dehydratase large subunit [Alphaproteobacteria bacterium]MDP6621669.1 3-isopropylmalate dehydratase large subunit [Alphaproteobacteria bacterium]
MAAPAQTLFDKIWDSHVVRRFEDGRDMVHVDRHMLYEITSMEAFRALATAARRVRNPGLSAATVDHMVATRPGRDEATFAPGREFIRALRANAKDAGIRLFDLGDADHGITHVIAHELAIVLPGLITVCGDSHTCTLGALGAVAFGIGTSDVEHVLSTQTLVLSKPATMRLTINGYLSPHASGKDLVLAILGQIGADGATGHAVEFRGAAVDALPIEERLTLCNMAIEFGARIALVAPDQKVFDYLRGRRFAPKGARWTQALIAWRALHSDPAARFDREVRIDAGTIEPMVTWGTSPEDAIPISGRVPDPGSFAIPEIRAAKRHALEYMGLVPGTPIEGVPVQTVFIGSCTNGRLGDLRAAARVAQGRAVAAGVRAIIAPGSAAVRRQAEAEGLAEVFRAAGFEWHEAGCSLCCAVGGELVPSGSRCATTSNRNFEGRQGSGARSHLVSPATAAAAAVRGRLTDWRRLED